jgi:hypothetical protein
VTALTGKLGLRRGVDTVASSRLKTRMQSYDPGTLLVIVKKGQFIVADIGEFLSPKEAWREAVLQVMRPCIRLRAVRMYARHRNYQRILQQTRAQLCYGIMSRRMPSLLVSCKY